MDDPCVAALFPLPLTAFEKYMFWDDACDYPMTFAMRLGLRGELHREAFDASIDEALGHHPLLRALVKPSGRGSLVWRLSDAPRPVVDWGTPETPIGDPRGERIDLSSEVGFRAWVRQGNGAAKVVLQFHHACCDAIGALRFIGHALAGYAIHTASGSDRPRLPVYDPSTLLRRGQFAAEPPEREARFGGLLKSVRDGARWIYRRPVVLRAHVAGSPANAARPEFLETHQHSFDALQTKRLRSAASRHGVTSNDLLLRDMFQTLREWREGQDARSASRWLRIVVPVNLRPGDDARTPAANGISYTFLTRDEGRCGDGDALLRGIGEEAGVITRRRRAKLFLRGFEMMERIPGAIRLYLNRNRCFATVALSNVGEVSRQLGTVFPCEAGNVVAGNVTLESIYGTPPVRPNTRASISIGRYGERLWLGIRCDPKVFSSEESRRLLTRYADRVGKTMDEGTTR
ncbi:MAG: hypothetical protein ABFC63_06265 [Thermoguttaceae bacterium]